MSDIKKDTDLKPADHILDYWLTKHGMAVTFDDARELLGDLREAFAREQFEETADRLANRLGIELTKDDFEDINPETGLSHQATYHLGEN